MEQFKRHLNVISEHNSPGVKNTTCFAEQAKHKVDCKRENCNNWIDYKDGHNCSIIAAEQGAHTMQKIGDIYKVSRMRICQIEKDIFQSIRSIGMNLT